MIPITNSEFETIELSNGYSVEIKPIDGKTEYELTKMFRNIKNDDSDMSDFDFGNKITDMMVVKISKNGKEFDIERKKVSDVLRIKEKTKITDYVMKIYNAGLEDEEKKS